MRKLFIEDFKAMDLNNLCKLDYRIIERMQFEVWHRSPSSLACVDVITWVDNHKNSEIHSDLNKLKTLIFKTSVISEFQHGNGFEVIASALGLQTEN
jgi:hypothetical protein